MRIAYISADPGVPVFGSKGCSIHVQEALRALLKRGAEVDLFATSCLGNAPAGLEAVQLHPLAQPPKGDLAVREKLSLAANEELPGVLRKLGGTGLQGRVFDLIYERYSLWSFAGMEYARATGAPAVLEVNAPLIEEQAEHRGLIDRASAERVAERAFESATVLIAVSDEVAAWLERFPAARGKVHVIPNGVDPGRFSKKLEPSRSWPPGSFTVGFVGTLKRWHGLTILVEAFSSLHARRPNARLLIVGDGPERQSLEADLSARKLTEFVHFTGAVAPEAVPGLLASMHVGVAPYPKLANFYFSPLKVYEYMAAGLPVVASRIGQLQNLIESGVTGLLTSPGDAAELANALLQLHDDPVLGKGLGQAARALVLRNHTWDAVVERILSLADVRLRSKSNQHR